mmetsp:Transcript_4924/g.10692  ORF Transcript_4924/g.10692 Transcript_4924/m.10692 type:complete len:217 (-) Transcript_4924:1570-2220(-)
MDLICTAERLKIRRTQNAQLVLEQPVWPDDLLHECSGDARVARGERVVEQVHLGVGVHGASERDASALPARKEDASVANQREVTLGKERKVGHQLARAENALVPLVVVWLVKQDVVAHRCAEDERRLGSVGTAAAQGDAAADARHVAEQRREEGRLASTDGADERDELTGAGAHIDRAEHKSFPRPSLAFNEPMFSGVVGPVCTMRVVRRRRLVTP